MLAKRPIILREGIETADLPGPWSMRSIQRQKTGKSRFTVYLCAVKQLSDVD